MDMLSEPMLVAQEKCLRYQSIILCHTAFSVFIVPPGKHNETQFIDSAVITPLLYFSHAGEFFFGIMKSIAYNIEM
jgi:hypothetical protein